MKRLSNHLLKPHLIREIGSRGQIEAADATAAALMNMVGSHPIRRTYDPLNAAKHDLESTNGDFAQLLERWEGNDGEDGEDDEDE